MAGFSLEELLAEKQRRSQKSDGRPDEFMSTDNNIESTSLVGINHEGIEEEFITREMLVSGFNFFKKQDDKYWMWRTANIYLNYWHPDNPETIH